MFKKIKEWIIHKLGGKTEEEYNSLNEFYKSCKEAKDDWHKLACADCRCAESVIELSEHPLFSEEDVVERSKEFVIRQLGAAVYEFAAHKVENGVYIASVRIKKWQ